MRLRAISSKASRNSTGLQRGYVHGWGCRSHGISVSVRTASESTRSTSAALMANSTGGRPAARRARLLQESEQ